MGSRALPFVLCPPALPAADEGNRAHSTDVQTEAPGPSGEVPVGPAGRTAPAPLGEPPGSLRTRTPTCPDRSAGAAAQAGVGAGAVALAGVGARAVAGGGARAQAGQPIYTPARSPGGSRRGLRAQQVAKVLPWGSHTSRAPGRPGAARMLWDRPPQADTWAAAAESGRAQNAEQPGPWAFHS